MPLKDTERYQLERFLQSDRIFSGTVIKDHERPDFIVENHGSPFGIEVLQLYRPAVKRSFAQRKVEAFREKIITRARNIYEQRKAPPVDVGVMFSSMSYAPGDIEPLADELAGFVQEAYPVNCPWVFFQDDDDKSKLPRASVSQNTSPGAVGSGP